MSDPSLADVNYPLLCNEKDCRKILSAVEWFWYVDAGSAHVTVCQEHSNFADGDWDYVCPATAVRLRDENDDEVFARLIDLSGTFHAEPEP